VMMRFLTVLCGSHDDLKELLGSPKGLFGGMTVSHARVLLIQY